ncbi:MAG: hypothetical protein IT306_00695, partial [Chloroflexi bacterium]|nr:hypothetical protein [Chloroflexota bacterium]
TPKAMAATRRPWDPLPVTLYGRQVTPLVFGCTALWYGALRDHPVRIVIVRDPSGRRRDEACFCTDLTVDHAFILEGYARRWTIETALEEVKVHQWAHPRPLRSKHPREVVQEVYGLLLAHLAIRTVMYQAALRDGIDPDRLSFTGALGVLRRAIPRAQRTPPDRLPSFQPAC